MIEQRIRQRDDATALSPGSTLEEEVGNLYRNLRASVYVNCEIAGNQIDVFIEENVASVLFG